VHKEKDGLLYTVFYVYNNSGNVDGVRYMEHNSKSQRQNFTTDRISPTTPLILYADQLTRIVTLVKKAIVIWLVYSLNKKQITFPLRSVTFVQTA
jgi:hypothetical protein